jgi:hypothetical protein
MFYDLLLGETLVHKGFFLLKVVIKRGPDAAGGCVVYRFSVKYPFSF